MITTFEPKKVGKRHEKSKHFSYWRRAEITGYADICGVLWLLNGYLDHPLMYKRYVEENFGDVLINPLSERYQVFAKSLVCAHCGLKGELLALEQFPGDMKKGIKAWHFNLYAIYNGEEVLMTKDHILPKSKGGKDEIDNLQTLCHLCNEAKANTTEDDLGVVKFGCDPDEPTPPYMKGHHYP